jgi:hypothetical protein
MQLNKHSVEERCHGSYLLANGRSDKPGSGTKSGDSLKSVAAACLTAPYQAFLSISAALCQCCIAQLHSMASGCNTVLSLLGKEVAKAVVA